MPAGLCIGICTVGVLPVPGGVARPSGLSLRRFPLKKALAQAIYCVEALFDKQYS